MTPTTPGPSTARVSGPRVAVFRAFAPGGIGNLGPGIDILGCAITGPGDTVAVTAMDETGVRIDDPGHAELPTDPQRHACGIAAMEVLRRANATSVGVALKLDKQLPLAGGQGGSAASAIAAAMAVNAFLGSPLGQEELLLAGLAAEERVAGRHVDNVAPSLLGGIILVRSVDPLDLIRLPVPPQLRVVMVHPDMRLRTADARAVLPRAIDRTIAMAQAAAVATMITAFCTGDLGLLHDAIDDRIAEPVRSPLLPGFANAKEAALGAGALGCSIAGGGPSSFALTDGEDSAERVLAAMLSAYDASGMRATGRVAEIDERGARMESTKREERPNPAP